MVDELSADAAKSSGPGCVEKNQDCDRTDETGQWNAKFEGTVVVGAAVSLIEEYTQGKGFIRSDRVISVDLVHQREGVRCVARRLDRHRRGGRRHE